MARTPDEVVKQIIGEQAVQLAVLTSQLETANEKIAQLEKDTNVSPKQ